MIDFEEDVPDNDAQRLQHSVEGIAQGIQQALDTASRGRLLRAGLQVTSPQPLHLHTPSFPPPLLHPCFQFCPGQ